jgi:hypothetical protein
MARPANPDEESLKRLGGGRWQTRDERFTIEPQSGTWSVVDAEETDDLGLPLVRGPFRSLTDAKEAIGAARASAAPRSPLAERIERKPGRDRESTADDRADGPGDGSATLDRSPRGRPASQSRRAADDAAKAPSRETAPSRQAGESSARAAEPAEPGWFRDLTPAERGRARRLIEQLTSQGEDDAVSIVRRDLVGDVPALAAHAIERRLRELGPEASAADVVELLADGRDQALGVRWRIVDGDGRPILIEPPKRSRRSR